MRSRKKKKKSTLLIIAICLVLGILAVGAYEAYRIYGPSRERMAEEDLFDVSGDETAILYQYELQKAKARTENGTAYLPIEWVQSILNKRFYWDETERLLVYALPEEVVKMTEDDTDDAGNPFFVDRDDKIWLSTVVVETYTDIRIETFLQGSAKRVFIESAGGTEQTAGARRKTVLRSRPSIKGMITADVDAKEELRIIPDHAGSTADPEVWQRVMTPDGFTGYIQKKKLYAATEREVPDSFTEPEYTSLSLGTTVLLGWHSMEKESGNERLANLVENASGLNVVSPTWFSLVGNDGDYESLASSSYVGEAHAKGLQVWPLISNFDDSVSLGTLLERTSVREKLINSLMNDADAFGFDGINVDFELVRQDSVKQYLEFIRELSVACRNRGLYLSVDVPNPASYNLHYDRAELGVFCDYVINMGYDEHVDGDDPGSVASIGFVKTGIEETAKEAGAEKTIAGVPFYTRLWKTAKDGTVTSEVMSQNGAADWVEKHSVNLEWDDSCGQYTGKYWSDDGSFYQIWMEEEKSIALKVQAVRDCGAAGIACWRLGLESDSMWSILSGEGD